MSNINEWAELCAKEIKKPVESLNWQTPEGITVKPLYTAEDLEGLEFVDSLPGFEPYARGVKASMYSGRPWTIRQYAGFSTAKESMHFTEEILPQVKRDFQLHSTLRLTGVMIRIIPELSAM